MDLPGLDADQAEPADGESDWDDGEIATTSLHLQGAAGR